MARLTRRNLLAGAALGAGAVTGSTIAPRTSHAADRAGLRYGFGHTNDFGEQYYTGMTRILELFRHNEMDALDDIITRMVEAIQNGGNVWMRANVGHMGGFENNDTNPGNPGIIRSSQSFRQEDYEKVQPGDVFVTNSVNEQVRALRDKGVYVVGVPVNYIDNEYAPEGFVNPNVNNWRLGDVSSVILQSYIPYTQGIVDCPQIPEMKLFPSSANALYLIFWAIQGEVAVRLKNKRAKKMETAALVMDTIIGRIHEAWRTEKDYMFDHAPTVAKMIGRGAHFHVTSDHGGVQSEANGVAMGPMMTNAFRKEMKKGDVHLLASMYPESQIIVDEAKKAKDLGMYVVSIAPSNATAIRGLSDVFIDNLCPEGAGLLDVKGYDSKIVTVSGVLNNTLMWIFTAQFVDEMVRRGWIPWFWMGYYTVGGREYCEAVRPFFQRQGF